MQLDTSLCVRFVLHVDGTAEVSWSNSSGGGHYGSPAAACRAMIDPGGAETFSHTEPMPGHPISASCYFKTKDGEGAPSYIGILSEVEDAAPTNLARGNLGERLAAERLAAGDHAVIMAKRRIEGTNQGGIDIVTMKYGTVYSIDNKALTRSGGVSSAAALTRHFPQNKQAVLDDLAAQLAKTEITDMERGRREGRHRRREICQSRHPR